MKVGLQKINQFVNYNKNINNLKKANIEEKNELNKNYEIKIKEMIDKINKLTTENDGCGIVYELGGQFMNENNGDKYIGQYINTKKEGRGVLYLKNGDIYNGDFKNDKKEGKGIFYYNDGNRYEGDYKNDKEEGKGIYYYYNGDREMGDYLNGKKIGKHVTQKMNGEIVTNSYK